MDHTVDLSLILRLDRYTVAVVPHGNHGILQVSAVGSRQHGVKLGVYLFICLQHGAADAFQSRAGIVGDLVFRQNAAVDFVCHLGQRGQLLKVFGQAVIRRVLSVFFSVGLDAGYVIQHGCDFHQLDDGQSAADFQ